MKFLLYGIRYGMRMWVKIQGVLAPLFLAALVAGYVPARRATNVNPIMALRYE